jgi:hypothetical protein
VDGVVIARRVTTPSPNVTGRLAAIHQQLAIVLTQRAQRFAGRTRKADPAASLIDLLLRAWPRVDLATGL